MTQLTKNKISKSNTGRRVSLETRKKIGKSHTGKRGYKHTEEARKKIGLASLGNKNCLGKKNTADHIHKAAKSHWKPVECLTTGERFESVKEASIKFNISNSLISRVCGGKLPHTHSLNFMYLTEEDLSGLV